MDVSLWITVTASNWPVASCASNCRRIDGWPHSTCSGSAFFPQRRATSSHLSEKAPHMQHRTALSHDIANGPSMTPQADEVERKTGCWVPNSFCKCGWMPA